jgi:DNA polymerase III alpha subunit (gram-positive type)
MKAKYEFEDLSRWLERPLVTVHLKATGPSAESDRVVQLCMKKLHPDNKLETMTRYLDPTHAITEKATEEHGITDAMVSCCFLLQCPYPGRCH